MNNSMAPKPEGGTIDTTPLLRTRQTEVTQVIEAIRAIRGSSHWAVLNESVFLPRVSRLTRQLRAEKDTVEIYRLQGTLAGAYITDLVKLENAYLSELKKLDNQLHDKTNPADGAA